MEMEPAHRAARSSQVKVLYLGRPSPLLDWLGWTELVEQTEAPCPLWEGCDWVISYNYHHKIPQEALDFYQGKVVNLHTGYLPYNRGAHPNLWSWLEDTPKGVTIHQVDAGIDTGPILAQRQVEFELTDKYPTLATTYDRLQEDVQTLFRINWPVLRHGGMIEKPQQGEGTYHKKADLERVQHLLVNGWDTPVQQLIGRGL